MSVEQEIRLIMFLLDRHPNLKDEILKILRNPEQIDERLDQLLKEYQ